MRFTTIHRARLFVPCVAALCTLGVSRVAGAQYPPPQTYPVYPQPQYPQPLQYPSPQTQSGTQASAVVAYRAPLMALAQPVDGGSVPEDKPVVVFRFMSGEPMDPIDALSFSVSVDGSDRTDLFQLTQGEAWGRLTSESDLLANGQHDVRARICTARGACAATKNSVVVIVESAAIATVRAVAADKARKRKSKVIDAAIQAARVILR